MKTFFRSVVLRMSLALASLVGMHSGAQAGIPVIDAANLLQTIQQVLNDITEIDNQLQQITQLQSQIDNISGFRGLGSILNSPLLRNYIPANAQNTINAVTVGGYAGLSPSAKTLRDASMVYNCLDKAGPAQTRCQATLAQPYQHKAFMQDALSKASGRVDQINSLLAQVDNSEDPKAVQELQARIEGENALLNHEVSQLQAAQYMAEAERNTQASAVVERRRENVRRTFRVSDTY
jgi:type IV secretion system protein VirB5